VYALKPTWNSISREGQKFYALIFDTLGLYARSVDDLDLLADAFALADDEESAFAGVQGARFAVCKTMAWNEAGPGTVKALQRATELLRSHGARVDEIELPSEFNDLPELHETALFAEGRVTFLSPYRVAKDLLSPFLAEHVENPYPISRKQQLAAFDKMAALRPKFDEIASHYDAVLVPSVPDEAPVGHEFTGNAIFCAIWSVSSNIPLPETWSIPTNLITHRPYTFLLSTFPVSKANTACLLAYLLSRLDITTVISSRSARPWAPSSRPRAGGSARTCLALMLASLTNCKNGGSRLFRGSEGWGVSELLVMTILVEIAWEKPVFFWWGGNTLDSRLGKSMSLMLSRTEIPLSVLSRYSQ
jgi:hypothetical protein